jgi:hypothetical protein
MRISHLILLLETCMGPMRLPLLEFRSGREYPPTWSIQNIVYVQPIQNEIYG